MRFHSTVAQSSMALMALCLFATPWCYGTQGQVEANKSPEVIIMTQYNNATQNSHSFLGSIPIFISETPDFNHLYITAAAEYPGRNPVPPETIKIGFGARPCHQLNAIEPELEVWVDGVSIYRGKFHRLFCEGGIKGESEFGTIEVSFKDFNRIAEATRVEVQIAEHRFGLNGDAQREFQRFARFLNGR